MIKVPKPTRITTALTIVLGVVWLAGIGHGLAETVTLAWDPNSETDLAGYRLYYGTTSRSYQNTIDVGNATSTPVSDLQKGATYYFAVTAYNDSGIESDYSNEVSYTAGTELPNRPPYALDLHFVITANQPVAINLNGFDPDDDLLNYTTIVAPQHGSIAGTAPLITYTPQTAFVGVDQFTYSVSDGALESAPATVTINVNQDPNPPPSNTAPFITETKYLGYGVVLTWTSEPGSSYRIEARNGFADPAWMAISDEIFAGGLRTSWLDPFATAAQGRLYRVQLTIP
jgi:hypothetical protein